MSYLSTLEAKLLRSSAIQIRVTLLYFTFFSRPDNIYPDIIHLDQNLAVFVRWDKILRRTKFHPDIITRTHVKQVTVIL